MNDSYKFGALIAKMMAEKITHEEELQLDEWVMASEDNMRLFENLVDEYKWRWAKRWFKEAGVSTSGIKWRKAEGWYKPENREVWQFYGLMIIAFIALAIVYFVLEL